MERRLRVGVLINTMYSDYSSTFLMGIDKYCKEKNYDQVIIPLLREVNSGPYDYIYDSNFSFLTNANIDVLVINSATLVNLETKQSFLDKLEKISGIPIISVGIPINGIPCVFLESKHAIKQLVNHVVKKHKRRNIILMHANGKSEESRNRVAKYIEALYENGIKLGEDRIIDSMFEYDRAYQNMENYIKNHENFDIDAILCMNDNMALGCISCLTKYNIRVPHDVIVTGYDNIIETYEDAYNITTIDQHIIDQAYFGVEIAIDYMNHGKVSMLNQVTATPVYRKSCGCKRFNFFFNDLTSKQVNTVEKKYGSRIQLTMLHHFLLENQDPLPLTALYERLSKSFELFEISNALLVLYNKVVKYEKNSNFELPEKAKLAMTFSLDKGIQIPNEEFSPKESFLPESYNNNLVPIQTIIPLFAKDEVYGYMLLSFGKYETIFYQTIYEILCKEVISSIKLDIAEEKVISISEEKMNLELYSEEMRNLSCTDELTGLLNRRGFYELAQNKIDSYSYTKGSGLVIYGDMDGLKKINDSLGHDIGDKAIQLEAEILKSVFGSSDIIGRLGGDEFGIVSFNKKEEDIILVQEKIDKKCKQIMKEQSLEFELSITLGCIEFTEEMSELTILLINADKNMYKNKNFKKSSKTNQKHLETKIIL